MEDYIASLDAWMETCKRKMNYLTNLRIKSQINLTNLQKEREQKKKLFSKVKSFFSISSEKPYEELLELHKEEVKADKDYKKFYLNIPTGQKSELDLDLSNYYQKQIYLTFIITDVFFTYMQDIIEYSRTSSIARIKGVKKYLSKAYDVATYLLVDTNMLLPLLQSEKLDPKILNKFKESQTRLAEALKPLVDLKRLNQLTQFKILRHFSFALNYDKTKYNESDINNVMRCIELTRNDVRYDLYEADLAEEQENEELADEYASTINLNEQQKYEINKIANYLMDKLTDVSPSLTEVSPSTTEGGLRVNQRFTRQVEKQFKKRPTRQKKRVKKQFKRRTNKRGMRRTL